MTKLSHKHGFDEESELHTFNGSEILNGKTYRGKTRSHLDTFHISTMEQPRTSVLRSTLAVCALVCTLVFLVVFLIVPLFNAVNHPKKELKTMDSHAKMEGHGHSDACLLSPSAEDDAHSGHNNDDMDHDNNNQGLDHDNSKEAMEHNHGKKGVDLDHGENSIDLDNDKGSMGQDNDHNEISNSSSISLSESSKNGDENISKEGLSTKNFTDRQENKKMEDSLQKKESKRISVNDTTSTSDKNKPNEKTSNSKTSIQTGDEMDNPANEEETTTLSKEKLGNQEYKKFLKYAANVCSCPSLSSTDMDRISDTRSSQNEMNCLYRCLHACKTHPTPTAASDLKNYQPHSFMSPQSEILN